MHTYRRFWSLLEKPVPFGCRSLGACRRATTPRIRICTAAKTTMLRVILGLVLWLHHSLGPLLAPGWFLRLVGGKMFFLGRSWLVLFLRWDWIVVLDRQTGFVLDESLGFQSAARLK